MRGSDRAKPVGTVRHVAAAQGLFNLVGGLWPLISMASFEAVYGPKADKWLERTVGGLLVTAGLAQLAARSDDELRIARILGIGVAGTLGAIDAFYVPKGRISAVYLQDLACEAFWVAAWRRAATVSSSD
jgi:hypothetical protein